MAKSLMAALRQELASHNPSIIYHCLGKLGPRGSNWNPGSQEPCASLPDGPGN